MNNDDVYSGTDTTALSHEPGDIQDAPGKGKRVVTHRKKVTPLEGLQLLLESYKKWILLAETGRGKTKTDAGKERMALKSWSDGQYKTDTKLCRIYTRSLTTNCKMCPMYRMTGVKCYDTPEYCAIHYLARHTQGELISEKQVGKAIPAMQAFAALIEKCIDIEKEKADG